MTRRRRGLAALGVAALVWSATARAGGAPDDAAAEALFDAGRDAMARGDLDAACRAFAASDARSPTAGAVLNLGDCQERSLHLGAAWATFTAAAARAARAQNAEIERYAVDRAKRVALAASALTLHVADAARSPVEVELDHARVDPARLGAPILLDGGTHVVEARAPGHRPFKAVVVLATDHDRRDLVVPPLAPDDAAAASAPSPMVAAGVVGIGVGAAALVTGAVLGGLAASKHGDVSAQCPDNTCAGPVPDDVGRANDLSKTYATLSTVSALGGAALVAGGLALVLGARSRASTRATTSGASASLVVSRGALALRTTFR